MPLSGCIIEAYSVHASKVACFAYRSQFNENRVFLVDSQGHTGLKNHILTWLSTNLNLTCIIGICQPRKKPGTLLGGQYNHYGLGHIHCSPNSCEIMRRPHSGLTNSLVPGDRCKPNSTEELEHCITSLEIAAMHNHDPTTLCGPVLLLLHHADESTRKIQTSGGRQLVRRVDSPRHAGNGAVLSGRSLSTLMERPGPLCLPSARQSRATVGDCAANEPGGQIARRGASGSGATEISRTFPPSREVGIRTRLWTRRPDRHTISLYR